MALGDRVSITADDYGAERGVGTIVHLGAEEIVIRRQDPALGEIAVHFPRSGYLVSKA